jgi:hypothetical protein
VVVYSEPLTTRAMTDLGLRVAGTTGKAKLQVTDTSCVLAVIIYVVVNLMCTGVLYVIVQVLKALRLITCDKDFAVTGVN